MWNWHIQQIYFGISNAICEKIKDEDMSLKIAYAIKAVYSERDYSRDVL